MTRIAASTMQFVRMQSAQVDAASSTDRRDNARSEHEGKINEIHDLKQDVFDEREKARDKIALGGPLGHFLGSLAGAVVGFLVAGPIGAVAGGIAGALGATEAGKGIGDAAGAGNREAQQTLGLEANQAELDKADAAANMVTFGTAAADAHATMKDSEQFLDELYRTKTAGFVTH